FRLDADGADAQRGQARGDDAARERRAVGGGEAEGGFGDQVEEAVVLEAYQPGGSRDGVRAELGDAVGGERDAGGDCYHVGLGAAAAVVDAGFAEGGGEAWALLPFGFFDHSPAARGRLALDAERLLDD